MSSLMVLGGSLGIGQAVADEAEDRAYDQVTAYGAEDFDIRSTVRLRAAVRADVPTHVVYSVGVNKLDWSKDIRWEDFTRLMEVNVYGFLNLMRVLQEESGPVSVVAVTSDAAWRPMRTSAIYCASKAALEMAIKVCSRELAPQGWRVNGVAPGKVADTAMTGYVDAVVPVLRGWTPEEARYIETASSPLGRPVTKKEVADVILAVLTGPLAQTGEIIAVNGGR